MAFDLKTLFKKKNKGENSSTAEDDVEAKAPPPKKQAKSKPAKTPALPLDSTDKLLLGLGVLGLLSVIGFVLLRLISIGAL